MTPSIHLIKTTMREILNLLGTYDDVNVHPI